MIGTATLVKDPANGIPFSSPEAALGGPWVSYAIGLQTTAGELIGGIDVTITGQLHQRWIPGEDDFGNPIDQPTPNSPNATNGDSHLRAAAGALFAIVPEEDNSLTGSPLANTPTATYGVGSYLRGAWGILDAATTANVAYICIPCGSIPSTQINITVASPTGDILDVISSSDFALSPTQPPAELMVGDLGPLVGDLRINPPDTPTIVSGTLPVSDEYGGAVDLDWMFDGDPTGPAPHSWLPRLIRRAGYSHGMSAARRRDCIAFRSRRQIRGDASQDRIGAF